MATSASFQSVDVRAAEALLKEKHVKYIDVRTPEEYAAGHAKGAVNKTSVAKNAAGGWDPVPGFVDDVKAFLGANPDTSVLVSCQAGRRSAAACARLAEAGLTGCIDVEGGFSAWTEAGLPVEK
jgi:rhodanese-related sulfurtransferase